MEKLKISGLWQDYENYSEGAEPLRLCSVGAASKEGSPVEVGVVYNADTGCFETVEDVWITSKNQESFVAAEGVFKNHPYEGYERVFVDEAFAAVS